MMKFRPQRIMKFAFGKTSPIQSIMISRNTSCSTIDVNENVGNLFILHNNSTSIYKSSFRRVLLL